MSQVSAVLLSIGEPYLERALASLSQQTVPVRELIRVENVHPFSRAFNQGASQVKTPYFLQLDADMVLDPNCIQQLLEGMQDDCALTIGHLRDPMLGVVVGVKLFRTACVQQEGFPETVSSDTDWLQKVTRQGWKHRYVTDERLQPCPTLGAHEPNYTSNYIFCKYARWAAAYWNEGDLEGIRNHLRTLLYIGHPGRWWGLLGFAEGLARPVSSDALVPYAEHPRIKPLENLLAESWSEVVQPAQTPREAHALGYCLGRSGRLVYSTDQLDWAFGLGVGLGLLDQLEGHCSHTVYPLDGPAFQLPPSAANPTWLDRSYPWWVRRLGPPGECTLPAPGRAGADCSGVAYFMWQAPAETFVEREIRALRQAGLKLHVLAQEGESGPPSDLKLAPSHPDLWRCLRLLVALRYTVEKNWELDLVMARQICWLADQLRRLKVRLIHSTWANPCALMALLAARLAGIACTTQVRAHEINRVVAPDLLPILLKHMDGVCTNSAFNARLLNGQARIIYNGLDLENFPSGPPREFELRPLPLRILSVARLVDPKGLDTLLKACSILRRRGIDLSCTIIGGCEEPCYTYTRVELARLRLSLGLEDCVHLIGHLPFAEILPYYANHHVFCLPAQIARDGSHDVDPNCILEAMAMGLPVVTTPIGAIPEQVGETALIVEPKQPELLAASLEKLWQEPELARHLSEQARKRCRRLFSSQRQAAELMDFFRGAGGEL